MIGYLLVLIVAFAFLVEAVWERLQDGFPEKILLPQVKVWGAVVIAVAVCLYFRVDLVAILIAILLDMAKDANVAINLSPGYSVGGAILTGFFISRGADGTHKALQMLFNIFDWFKNDRKPIESIDGMIDEDLMADQVILKGIDEGEDDTFIEEEDEIFTEDGDD